MKRIILLVGIGLGLMGGRQARAEQIAWTGSPQQASDDAHASGRMIIVSVGASWCHYCQRMDREVWSDPNISRRVSSGFVPLKVNDEQHGELIRSLRVTGFPSTLIYSHDRRLLARIDGFVSAKSLSATLDRLRRSSGQDASVVP